MSRKGRHVLAGSLLLATLQPGLGQAEIFDPRTSSDLAPWASARAAALGEAVSPIAYGADAIYYNPALLGDAHTETGSPLRAFYFPFMSLGFDPASQDLARAMRSGVDSEAVTTQLQTTDPEHYPYARASLGTQLHYRSFVFAYTYDVRAAASQDTSSSQLLDIDYRTQMGPIVGFSLGTDLDDLSWGFTSGWIQRSETRGSFTLDELNDASDRRSALRREQRTYRGTPLHTGLLWRLRGQAQTRLSLVVRNLGGTAYRSQADDVATYYDREDLTLGAQVRYKLGSFAAWSGVFELNELTRNDRELKEKIRVSSELEFGSAWGSPASFALRLGYRFAGLSYGVACKLALLTAEFAAYPEDIGAGNQHVLESRNLFSISINLAD